LLHFALAFSQNLASLERDQPSQLVLGAPQFIADLPHDFAALRRGQHAPSFKDLPGLPDDVVIILLDCEGDATEFHSGRGIIGNDFAADNKSAHTASLANPDGPVAKLCPIAAAARSMRATIAD